MKTKHGSAVHNNRASLSRVAKVNDQVLPVPDRHINETVLRAQWEIPTGHVLLRDHNDPNDPVIQRGAKVDLAEGSVFYSVPECDLKPNRGNCLAPPKHVVTMDDHPETFVKTDQTGRSIRDFFELANSRDLFWDSESSDDQKVEDDTEVDIRDGNVFVTRSSDSLKIKVNNQEFREADGVKETMTGAEIAQLAFPKAKKPTVKKITDSEKIKIPLGDTITIENCDTFRVIRPDVIAGFQSSRVVRELQALREGGATITLLRDESAVIYHDVPAGNSKEVDVLVQIPSGYPARMLDNALLPAESPLAKTAPGAEQGVVEFGGRKWQKKSVHPHKANCDTAWDQNTHGLHTYFGEILSWLA